MLAGDIPKSSKRKIEPKPVDPTKKLIDEQLKPLATVMGRIEDIVSTGDENTDSTPLKDEEIEELRLLVTLFSKNLGDLQKQVSWTHAERHHLAPPPIREHKYHDYTQQP